MLVAVNPPGPESDAAAPILWDIVEEHLDEAAFLYTQWERALQSPEFTLAEVRDRVEERLLAHIDALVVGGRPVVGALLQPALGQGGQGVAFAAAMALLAGAGADSEAAVIAALGAAAPPQAGELVRALQLCPSPRRQAMLMPLRDAPRAAVRAAAARILGFQQLDLGAALPPLLYSEQTELVQAALYCLRYRPRRDAESAIRQASWSADAELATAGLLAAAAAGSPELLYTCRQLVRARHPAAATAALLLGLLGGQADAELLLGAVAAAAPAADAAADPLNPALLFALGFHGSRAVAAACVDWLRTPSLVLGASEAFLTITGVDIDKAGLALPAAAEPEDDEDQASDADLYLPPEASLVRLDAAATASFWAANQDRFAEGTRYFRGQPLLPEAPDSWRAALGRANMRQRHPLALALASISAGREMIQTQALAREQRL